MTQNERVLNHLKHRGSITATVAIGMYGISRLAEVIRRLKEAGTDITTQYHPGVTCTRYAEYTLMK